MKNLITYLSKKSLSLGNGSGMTRKRLGNDSGMTRIRLAILICLCMLTIGVGQMWATKVTSTFTNTSMGVGTGEPTWSSSTTPTAFEDTGSKRGVSWSKVSTTLTNTSLSSYSISQVDVVTSANGSGGTITVTVGGNSFSSTSASISSGDVNVSHTFTGSATTGNIQIGLPAGEKSIWVKSISVTYSSCGGTKLGTPIVTATPTSGKVTLTWSAVSNASGYQLNWNGGGWASASSGIEKTGLTDGTTYTYQVKAIGNGDDYCDGDASASASVVPGTYYTVTWNAAGSSPQTTSVRSGTKPTFPSTPSSCDATSTTFVGWTTSTWDGKKDDVSAYTIHTSSSTMPNVSGAITYNAVFAEVGAASGNYKKGSVDDLTEGQTVIIVNSNSGYALSSDRDAYGCQVATTAGISSGTITSPSSDLIWEIELGENGGYNIKQGDNYLNAYYYNSAHRIFFDQYPDEWQVSGSGPYVLSSTEDPGYQLWYDGDYYDFGTGTGTSGIAYNMDFYVPAPSYSKYLTTCCTPLGEPATLTFDKTAYTITATWTATSGGHEDGYSVQLYNSSSVAIDDPIEIDCTSSCDLEYEFTSLSANTTYYVGVTPTYSGGTTYCSTGTEKKLSVKTDQVYTVTYNNGGGSGTMTDSNNPYEAGDEVTVKENTFTKSGYTFTAWSYSPAVTVTDGKFEMPSSNVVITATWTAKKNYYVDRMHGNCDGVNTVTIDGVVYNCYLREGAGYTRPDLTDNDGGTNDCVTGHAHFIGWVAAGNISADGSYSSGTIYAGGSSGTATTDGTIYYAVWAEE